MPTISPLPIPGNFSDPPLSDQHPHPHPHYLLHQIDNQYRSLLSTQEKAHNEIKRGYESIMRLQESLILRQAQHIAALEGFAGEEGPEERLEMAAREQLRAWEGEQEMAECGVAEKKRRWWRRGG